MTRTLKASDTIRYVLLHASWSRADLNLPSHQSPNPLKSTSSGLKQTSHATPSDSNKATSPNLEDPGRQWLSPRFGYKIVRAFPTPSGRSPSKCGDWWTVRARILKNVQTCSEGICFPCSSRFQLCVCKNDSGYSMQLIS